MPAETRPVFLDLTRIRLPVAGILSIAHRLSGMLLFLGLPLIVALLDLVLSGETGFARAVSLLDGLPARLFLLLYLWALLHHLLAGIRYLLLDVELGVEAPRYRQSAWLVLGLAPLLALLLLGGLR
ncbi:MAG TPA: succinate dehydrogenase, cytochrome b556 subunit [Chromatiaceae bacterium]|nr:succinate dehydrogenase, cytochrome b556 subunit [Chromatiaceae bacterium]